jgi:ribosomal protein S27AE
MLSAGNNKECPEMTKINDIVNRATCALCGKGVHIDNHEGRVACNGCNMATDNCTCAPVR